MTFQYNAEETLDHLKKIASMVTRAAEADTLQQVLQRIADMSRRLIGAKYAALGVPDGSGGLEYFKVSGITEDEIEQISHPPVGDGLLGVIMNEREHLRLAHMSDDDRSVGFPDGHPHMDSLLGVPIVAGEQLYGMLYLTDRIDGKAFEERDQWLIETMAGYAALAIAGTQLREQHQRLTLLEERNRIGMELHDGVIQSLYAIGMHLDLARRKGSIGEDEILIAMDGLNQVIEDIRTYIQHLNSRSRSLTIREGLQRIIERLHIPSDLTVHIDAPDIPPPFTPAAFESISLIVNEALSNVVRHANANNVRLSMKIENSTFHIVISDDGHGFDPEQPRNQKGLGLKNLRHRAKLYRGDVTISSSPGPGTTIAVSIPIGEKIKR